jgi:hypothetical protein
MRARLAAAGIDGAGVSVAPGAGLTITAPAGARADVTALAARGRLGIYDWERSVLGPRATPAADDAGARIQGGLTPRTAPQIAAILSTGPLPAALSQPSG